MEICEKSDGSSYDSPPSVKNKPGNTCDICEQFVPGNAGSLKVHKCLCVYLKVALVSLDKDFTHITPLGLDGSNK